MKAWDQHVYWHGNHTLIIHTKEHGSCRPVGSKFEIAWQYYYTKRAHIHTPPFPPPSPYTPPQEITMLSITFLVILKPLSLNHLVAAVMLVNDALLLGSFLVFVTITICLFVIYWWAIHSSIHYLRFDGDLPQPPCKDSCFLRTLLVLSWSKNWTILVRHFCAGWLAHR